MNAIQFIKEHGFDKAREVVEGAPDWASEYCTDCKDYVNYDDSCYDGFSDCESCVSVNNLKRFVESVHLVGEYGGLYGARDFISGYSEEQLAKPIYSPMLRLKQAIADYEAIYGKEDA